MKGVEQDEKQHDIEKELEEQENDFIDIEYSTGEAEGEVEEEAEEEEQQEQTNEGQQQSF